MIYCFDFDGTLCTNTYGKYHEAEPLLQRIDVVNNLYFEGHIIKIFTARGTGTGLDWEQLTKLQLSSWGIEYHELIMGKPEADFFIDDRGLSDIAFFND